MHKQCLNEAVIRLAILPKGPILIKAGEDPGDPSRPDMSFVRTMRAGRPTVYLPGSSLKGVLRAHCERLARTVDSPEAIRRRGKPLSCNPLGNADGPERPSRDYACSRHFERDNLAGPAVYRGSCFICQLFGHTSLASHLRIEDAYPSGEVQLEERNGVAIDRVFGSVAVGPFNLEAVTSGEFVTTLRVRNFTVAQLGLVALALRDLVAERVRVGFGKSRGLGAVTARVEELSLRYPLCELQGGRLQLLGGEALAHQGILGVGAFPVEADYGFPDEDYVPLPHGYQYHPDALLGAEVRAPSLSDGGVDWQPLGRACVARWKEVVRNGRHG